MIDHLAIDLVGIKRRKESRAGVMNSSLDLIVRARTGDHEAFRLLFERYARPILSFVFNQVGRHDVAEELTQETFVRAYSHLQDLRDAERFSTWLFGIARNVAREWLRTGATVASSLDVGSFPEQLSTSDSSPADDYSEKELSRAILRALRSLDEDRRVVFSLKVLQGTSYQEITEITGFSLAKVKTDLHRARGEMRQKLRRYVEMK
ncbi:MAG TPA: RNA polymerase sigma factor [Pyrinomonadaceae bacterium]|nr:RNA polymerase sigma factor [Pyrinomonadaceae bacterium]